MFNIEQKADGLRSPLENGCNALRWQNGASARRRFGLAIHPHSRICERGQPCRGHPPAFRDALHQRRRDLEPGERHSPSEQAPKHSTTRLHGQETRCRRPIDCRRAISLRRARSRVSDWVRGAPAVQDAGQAQFTPNFWGLRRCLDRFGGCLTNSKPYTAFMFQRRSGIRLAGWLSWKYSNRQRSSGPRFHPMRAGPCHLKAVPVCCRRVMVATLGAPSTSPSASVRQASIADMTLKLRTDMSRHSSQLSTHGLELFQRSPAWAGAAGTTSLAIGNSV